MANYDENEDELVRLRARVEELELAERRHADESRQLAQNEAQMRTIIDNIPISLSLKDASLRYLLANRTFSESTQWSAEDIHGKFAGDIFRDELAESMLEGDREVLETGKTITQEISMGVDVRLPGIRQITKFPVTNSAGTVDGIVTVSIDITDRKKGEQDLRRSEERFRDFSAAASDVLWELDADLRHSYLSDRYYELTGKSLAVSPACSAAKSRRKSRTRAGKNICEPCAIISRFGITCSPAMRKMAVPCGFPAAACRCLTTITSSRVIAAL